MTPLSVAALAVVGLVLALVAVLGLLVLLYRSVERERAAWQHERWELNTRLTTPEVGTLIAPPLPTVKPGEPKPGTRDEKEPEALHLVGTIVGAS